jgi:DNA ligase-1
MDLDWLKATPRGLYCVSGDFYIDPASAVPRAVITHGHGDHARPGHGAVLATPETLAIMRRRLGEDAGGTLEALRYGETRTIGGVTLRLVPAGHILGSAQAVLDHDGARVVVSGDYKRRPDPTCASFEPIPCDVFITEATFGLPVFRHPDDAGEIDKLLHSVALFPERCHLVGVYALGKCQRVLALLRRRGYAAPVYLHGALAGMVEFGRGAWAGAAGGRRDAPGASRKDRAGAAFGRHRAVGAAPARPGGGARLRMDAGQAACQAARRRAAARDFRPRRLGRAHAHDPRGGAVGSVGDAWRRGRAGAPGGTDGLCRAAAVAHRLRRRGGMMERFARLLDALLFTPARLGKLRLMQEYFASTGDPERGWALAALTGEIAFAAVKPAQIRDLALTRIDAELFQWSYDFVGDLAETVSLIWPERAAPGDVPDLAAIVAALTAATRADAGPLLERWLDRLDATGRWALLKLVTGGLRIGVSARLAKTALAEWAQVPLDDIEAVWHGLAPPYAALFPWLEGKAPRPETAGRPTFTPLMLAQALDDEELAKLDPADYRAEWKWDGIRVQLVARGGRRLYSRSGDDVGPAFPEIVSALPDGVVLDGELLVVRDGEVAPFNDLQQRLNRKTPAPKQLLAFPAWVRLYDLLEDEGEDLRGLPFDARRRRLEAWYARSARPHLDLSPLIPFQRWDELQALRDGARARGIEGIMLKRADSAYLSGRPKGPWFKWKRDALTVDAVLMYAQRGHGKRSSLYSDYTFGVWRDAELVPVGKAYFGFTDDELRRLDRYIREHTVERFGPVRAVAPELVLEIAFDSIHRSPRHKSGLAMRFPRIHRIRWDKPAREADDVTALERLVT